MTECLCLTCQKSMPSERKELGLLSCIECSPQWRPLALLPADEDSNVDIQLVYDRRIVQAANEEALAYGDIRELQAEDDVPDEEENVESGDEEAPIALE